MVRPRRLSLHTDAPFALGGYSGAAVVPEAGAVGGAPAPPREQTVSPCLWVCVALRKQGRRGTLTGQRGQPLCPGETTTHPDGSRPSSAARAANERRADARSASAG